MSELKSLDCAKSGHCECKPKLDGKTVIITGANAGIGFETAKSLSSRGYRLILACRNEEKAAEAVKKLKSEFPHSDVEYVTMDLNSLQSVRNCANQILMKCDKVDILINNAGIATVPELTEDGYDIHFQANHLGHFLFTNLILDLLRKSDQGRIVNVSSLMHYLGKPDWNFLTNVKPWSWTAYGNAKLYNILFTKGLAKRLKDTNITANSLHPGVVKTNFGFELQNKSSFWNVFYTILRPLSNPFIKTSEGGAQTSIHLAVCPELANVTGKYFSDCKECESSAASNDEANIDKLWELSMTYSKL